MSQNTTEWLDSKPILDVSRLDSLRDLAGANSASLVNELIDLFESTTPPILKDLKTLANTKQLEELRKLAHTFKSTCANLGASRLQVISIRIEKLESIDEISLNTALIESLEDEYKSVVAELKKYATA